MSNTIIIAVVVLVVAVVIFYAISMLMRKKTEDRILELEERKEALFDLPVQEELDAIKKMHLVGQSQTIFREWNQKWIDLSSNSFADLEQHIFEAEELNDSFHFFRARESVDTSEGQIEVMEEEVEAIRNGISQLTDQEKSNTNRIKESLDLYESLRNEIAEEAESYGTAIAEIEKQLNNIETEFQQFVTLNSTGDPIEAAEVLETAEEHTIALRAITERIPRLVSLIDEKYPSDLHELAEAYRRFQDGDFVLPDNFDVEQSIQNTRDQLHEATELLEKFELDRAEESISHIKGDINSLYEVFEKEYAARKGVEKRSSIIKDYIIHTRDNNRNLLLEIDHAMQSYILSENEKGSVRSYQEQLDTLEVETDELLEDIAGKKEPYSNLDRKIKYILGTLEDIERDQLHISEILGSLKSDELLAQNKADKFDNDLRIIKRYVEKRNLPGLPKDYLDLFFMTSDRIQTLFKELNKVRINIDAINHMVLVSEKDMDRLKDTTDLLIAHATLAEQLMQYANRYKSTDERIALGVQRALQLFDRDRDYNRSFDEISRTLELVEAGAAERIAGVYESTKDKPDYRN